MKTYEEHAIDAIHAGKPKQSDAYSVDQRCNFLLVGVVYALLAIVRALDAIADSSRK